MARFWIGMARRRCENAIVVQRKGIFTKTSKFWGSLGVNTWILVAKLNTLFAALVYGTRRLSAFSNVSYSELYLPASKKNEQHKDIAPFHALKARCVACVSLSGFRVRNSLQEEVSFNSEIILSSEERCTRLAHSCQTNRGSVLANEKKR